MLPWVFSHTLEKRAMIAALAGTESGHWKTCSFESFCRSEVSAKSKVEIILSLHV